jgi:hypothetical protein
MRTSSLLIALFLSFVGMQMAQADISTIYDVTTTFDDGTTFSGAFTYDSTDYMVTGLSGVLNDAGMGDYVGLLAYQLPSPTQIYDGNGGMLASVYLLPTATPYTDYLHFGANNAFVTIDFNPNDPTTVSLANINQTVFMDCTAASGMAPYCATGTYNNGNGGTMANPQSETISFVSSSGTAPVPLPSAVWTFLAGTLGLLSLGKKRKTV